VERSNFLRSRNYKAVSRVKLSDKRYSKSIRVLQKSANPDDNIRGMRENAAHLANLVSTLSVIALVDTESVYPENTWLCIQLQM